MAEAAAPKAESKKPLDPFRSFEVSQRTIEQGVRVEVADPLGGGTFGVRVSYPNDENPAFLKEVERIAREARESNEAETVVLNDIYVKAFANVCIFDWDPMEVGGKPFPCTKENIALLQHRAPRFIRLAYAKAQDIAKFLKINEAAEEKN